MAFLQLNGVTVRTAHADGAQRSVVYVGDTGRGFDGTLRGGPSVRKREWRFTTVPLDTVESAAVRGLVEGRGESFPLDVDLYSAGGQPSASGAATFVAGKWASASRLAAGASVSWALQLPADWTLLYWSLLSGTWRHSLLRNSGSAYRDGVAASFAAQLAVAGGTLTATGVAGETDFDDVVALPFRVPDAWVPSLYAEHSARAWSALPTLRASGEFAPAPVLVQGEVTDVKTLRTTSGGNAVVAERVSFVLRGV